MDAPAVQIQQVWVDPGSRPRLRAARDARAVPYAAQAVPGVCLFVRPRERAGDPRLRGDRDAPHDLVPEPDLRVRAAARRCARGRDREASRAAVHRAYVARWLACLARRAGWQALRPGPPPRESARPPGIAGFGCPAVLGVLEGGGGGSTRPAGWRACLRRGRATSGSGRDRRRAPAQSPPRSRAAGGAAWSASGLARRAWLEPGVAHGRLRRRRPASAGGRRFVTAARLDAGLEADRASRCPPGRLPGTFRHLDSRCDRAHGR